MRIFGFEITRQKAGPPSPVYAGNGGWTPIVREPFTGAWQRNIVIDQRGSLSNPIVWACITRIAQDVSNLPMLLQRRDGKVWQAEDNPAYSNFLRNPNHYQNHAQFKESWILSKVIHGNTYSLLERDNRNVVMAQYILDPSRVKVLQADDSSVFYELSADKTAGLETAIRVPASEIIHDRFNTLYHPLIGMSPMYAAAYAATYGRSIQDQSTQFFQNNSQPGGILVAPQKISQENADRIKQYWEQKFSGNNAGKIAVLGDGMKYERLSFAAKDSQVIEQLDWTDAAVCSAFHVPQYMVGLGDLPGHENSEAQFVSYYVKCLQKYVQDFEVCQTMGMKLANDLRLSLDQNELLRMNPSALMESLAKGTRGGFVTPNEARQALDALPVTGGDTVYMQEQDHSLEALAKRDAGPDPFGKAKAPAPTPAPVTPPAKSLSSTNVEIMAAGAWTPKKRAAA